MEEARYLGAATRHGAHNLPFGFQSVQTEDSVGVKTPHVMVYDARNRAVNSRNAPCPDLTVCCVLCPSCSCYSTPASFGPEHSFRLHRSGPVT